MRILLPLAIAITLPQVALTQAAAEHHAWQDARTFEPLSRTAMNITGAISLSGNPDFATPGSIMEMTFVNGAAVTLTSKGARWAAWADFGRDLNTGEIFQFSMGPGTLENGNTLCGEASSDDKLYAVFYEQTLFGATSLMMAVFQSGELPLDINSPGLCGTFTYEIGESVNSTPDQSEAAAGSEVVDAGQWNVSTDVNPLDDTKSVYLMLNAETSGARFGETVTLVARCRSNTTEVYVDWNQYLGDDSNDVYSDWKRVTVRVGEEEASTERWGISTDNSATFAPDWAGNFLKELLDEERLVLRTIPYGENPVTAVFNVTGLRNVLGELSETCGWTF